MRNIRSSFGYIEGDFTSTLLKAQNVEVAVKKYKKGEYESIHYHKVVAEITVTLQDTIIVVVKHPGER